MYGKAQEGEREMNLAQFTHSKEHIIIHPQSDANAETDFLQYAKIHKKVRPHKGKVTH